MINEENGGEGVTLVSGTKPELDENLTDEEVEALETFYEMVERQGDIAGLDDETRETLEKIWIVRKTFGELSPIVKAFLGSPTVKRR
jgi:hypothetical protein